jgi:hypothetical protein
MADDGTPRRPAGPEPASDAKKHANKLVVLSSSDKEPLTEAESLLGEASVDPKAPPSLPAQKTDDGLIRPVGWTTRPGGTTTIIKLPPKTGVLPRLTSLSPKNRPQPPPLPKQGQPAIGDDDAKRLPPIKLQPSALPAASESESIFSSGNDTPPPKVESQGTSPSLHASSEKKKTQPLRTVFASKPSETEAIARPESLPHPASLIHHAPPLVAHDASAPASEEESAPKVSAPLITPVDGKKAELAQAVDSPAKPDKPAAISAANVPWGNEATQRLLPVPERPGATPSSPARALPGTELKSAESEARTMRLPPRAATSARLKKAPEAGDVPGSSEKPADTATPPKVFPATPASTTRAPIKATTTPPTIPLRPAPGATKPLITPIVAAGAAISASAVLPPADPDALLETAGPGEREKKPMLPSTRAARMRKRRIVGIVAFYILFAALLPGLYFAAIYFSEETRLEGQIIPPTGLVLANEAFIVTDFSDLSAGIASDLASDRMIVMQDMQEKQGHVQRAQADVAARESRIRELNDQLKANNQAQLDLVKDARAASQQIWDGPGAELDADYQSKLGALNQAIAARAKANHLQYDPDPNFFSPEVWANAYRLALYQVPAGVDTVKERLWLDQQMKVWHDFTKSMDQRMTELREKAAQLKLSPAAKVADLKTQADDLQTRVDGTLSEEEPLKAELEQAQADLAAVQKKEAKMDVEPMGKLDALPEANIIMRLPLNSRGRFSWREMGKEKFYEAEKAHVFWLFTRAYRSADGRQYWALHRFTVDKDSTAEVVIEPGGFASTKSILRPDLSPDEQAQ